MLVFAETKGPRLDYIVSYLFGSLLGQEVELTTDPGLFTGSPGEKLNYSGRDFTGVPRIIPQGLLGESGCRDQAPVVESWEGIPCFFRSSEEGPLPFDILAASFWMISRYEEYLPFEPDPHDRFPARASLAWREGFIERPVVQLWAGQLGRVLAGFYPGIRLQPPPFSFLSSIDIDLAWAYKYRPWWRILGAGFRDLVSWQWNSLLDRSLVLTGFREDPYENYAYLDLVHRRYGQRPVYFFLVGPYGPFGKNISPRHPAMIHLVEERMELAEVGLHPSYGTLEEPGLLADEKARLEAITGGEVTRSRQHFLRFRLPDTYRMLARAGIRQDYSMGFPEALGFRAGTAVPFLFYDLEKEEQTGLEVLPLVLMDGTLGEYLQLDPEEAMERSVSLLEEVKKYGGHFTSLWHNHSVSEKGPWKGWRPVFETILEKAAE